MIMYWQQFQDLKLGGIISATLRELLWRTLGGGMTVPVCVAVLQQKDKPECPKSIVNQRKTSYLKLKSLALLYVWENARVWLTEVIFFNMNLTCLGLVYCGFHILSVLRDHHREWLQSDSC